MYDAAAAKREERQRLIHDLEWFATEADGVAQAITPPLEALRRIPPIQGYYRNVPHNALVGVEQKSPALGGRLRFAFQQAESAENEARGYEKAASRLQYAIDTYRRAAADARREAQALRAQR